MSDYTSQNNENVVNVEKNTGNIFFPRKEASKNERHFSNPLFAFFALLAFFGLLTFVIIYFTPNQNTEVKNQAIIINRNTNQSYFTDTNLNSTINSETPTKIPNINIKINNKPMKKTEIISASRSQGIKKKERPQSNLDFTPADCSGTSNGCN